MTWCSEGTFLCFSYGWFFFAFKFLVFQELEMDRFMENRDQLLKSYESLLKKEKAETDRYKHDVQSYQHFMLKNTPTPSKQYEAGGSKFVIQLESNFNFSSHK
jgi:hypothetical protein